MAKAVQTNKTSGAASPAVKNGGKNGAAVKVASVAAAQAATDPKYREDSDVGAPSAPRKLGRVAQVQADAAAALVKAGKTPSKAQMAAAESAKTNGAAAPAAPAVKSGKGKGTAKTAAPAAAPAVKTPRVKDDSAAIPQDDGNVRGGGEWILKNGSPVTILTGKHAGRTGTATSVCTMTDGRKLVFIVFSEESAAAAGRTTACVYQRTVETTGEAAAVARRASTGGGTRARRARSIILADAVAFIQSASAESLDALRLELDAAAALPRPSVDGATLEESAPVTPPAPPAAPAPAAPAVKGTAKAAKAAAAPAAPAVKSGKAAKAAAAPAAPVKGTAKGKGRKGS